MAVAGTPLRGVRLAALFTAVTLAAGPVRAGTSELRVLLDLDDNPATGCTVAMIGGPFLGADEILTATVVSGVGTANVTALARQTCPSGILSPPSPVVGPFAPPWPVGLGLGTGGAGVVEAYLPLSGSQASNVRAAFVTEIVAGGSGGDALLTTTGAGDGGPIYLFLDDTRAIPALGRWGLLALATLLVALGASLIRRRVPATLVIAGTLILGLGLGVAWAAITLDGAPGDWSSPPVANDPVGDGPAGADIVAAFAEDEYVGGTAVLFLRLDIVFNDPPVAQDDSFTVFEEAQATGNLLADNGNGVDSDPNSDPLSISTAPASGPDFGGVVLAANGSFTYTPPLNFTGTATFEYELLDSQGGNDIGSVSIIVNPVNDAPSFTKGPDDAVGKNSGARTVAGWATAISPGPADESGQAVDFIVSNDNNALFSVQPAVSPTGTLTYTPAANTTGSATVSVQIHDNGGTANGGVDTSAIQTVAVSVFDVNTVPSFTKGADQTVYEDAGPQSVANWATAISKGTPDESGQTVDFIVSNDNNALFSAQPAVSPTGTLTYTPAANAIGSASVSVQIHDNGGTANGGVDTSAVQTFTITVDPVNDPPAFTKGANETVLEDSGAQSVPGWATAISPGPADESAQSVSFNVTGNTNAGLFAAGPAVSPTGTLTYTPAANAFGSATISLEAVDNGGTANGGDDTSVSQTFVVNVTGVNDEPSFIKGVDQTVDEDAGAQSVPNWATAISPGPASESGQTVSFNVTGNTNAGLFATGPAVSPTGTLTYTPAANANGAATITLDVQDSGGTANGGDDTSPSQTFVITVNAVNDEPSFTKGADETVFEDSGVQTVAGWATAISPGPADESGQNVSFNVTGNTNPGLFATSPTVSSTGTLTYTPAADVSGSATITIEAQDNGGTANGGDDTSASQTFDITVTGINDEPSFSKGADETVLEDAGAQSVATWATSISPGPAAESGQTVSFNVTGNTNAALFSADPAVASNGTLTFTPAANASGTATITIEAHDNGGTADGGDDTSPPQTFVITVNAVNDEPSFIKGADEGVNEDSGAQSVPGWATAISPGPTDESGQTVTFNVTGSTNPGLFSSGPAVGSTGALTYTPAANTAGTATITIEAQDNGGTANGGDDTSPTQSFVITVTGINDAPSFAKGADQVVSEDAGAQTVNPWATAISPGPADESAQTVAFTVTGNTNPGLFSAGPAISPAGVLTYTSATNAFGAATITLSVSDNGGTANGGVDTSPTQTFTITVSPVNDPPAPGADSWDTVGNTELRVDLTAAATPHVIDITASTFGVLDNDSDPVEGDALAVSGIVGCGDVTAPFGDSPGCASANGGSVVMQANGRFSFVPKDGDTLATDTFTYTLTDNGTPSPASANGTVTITRYERVWYVRNNAAPGGLGRSTDPFDTLAEAQTDSVANDWIFVHFGDGTSTGQAAGITLKSGQHLIGEHNGLALAQNLNGNGNPQTLFAAVPGNRPLIDNIGAGNDAVSATNEVPVEIVGLSLQSVNAKAVDFSNAFPGLSNTPLSIRNNVIRGAGAGGIDVELAVGTTGTLLLTITGNSWNAAGTHTGNAIEVTRGAGALQLNLSDNTGILSTATAVNIAGGAAASTTITGFANNTVHQNTGGSGIVVSNATFDATPGATYNVVSGGTTVIGTSGDGVGGAGLLLDTGISGDLAFTDLDIVASAGTGLKVSGTGAVNVGAGTGTRVTVGTSVATISATGGPAADVSNATIDLQLFSLTSSNSPTTGVSLVNVADATNPVFSSTFSAPSGSSISNATGSAFNLDGGNATVSYAGTINNSANRAVVVQNRTADTATFSGNITDTGTGILLNSNTGSTIAFSGVLNLTTGANAAFTATAGGTVTATGSPNVITTTTGTALNVANTTIGAAGMMFRSISAGTGASGPANGIVLNNTGTSGGLTVTGTGSAGTGGVIQRCTSTGISLTTTRAVNLSWMDVQNNGDNGIHAVSVTNLNLTGLRVQNNTNALTEAGIKAYNLFGTNTWSGVEVSGSTEDNVNVTNDAAPGTGVLNSLTISGSGGTGSTCKILNNSTGSGNVGINIQANLTAQMDVVDINNCVFQGNRTIAVRADQADTSTIGDADDGSPAGVRVANNYVIAGSPNTGNQGIEISAVNGEVAYDLDNNRIGTDGATPAPLLNHGINVFLGSPAGTGKMRGFVRNNIVRNPNSGSGFGIRMFPYNGTYWANVNANTVQNVALDYGLFVGAGENVGAAGNVQVAVTNNNVSVQSGALDAIRVQARNTSTTCARISSNTTSVGGLLGGIADCGGNFCGLFVRQANTATFNLEGLTAGSQTAATTRTFVLSQNGLAATVGAIAATNFTGVANNFCSSIP